MPTKIKKVGKNKFDVEITCDTCGKPISVTNQYGMFCENLCGLEESKEAKKKVDKLLRTFIKGCKGFEFGEK